MQMKKILALVLALTMVFALAACGGNGDTTGNGDQQPTEPTAPTGDVTYTVTVKDIMGNSYTENIIILFMQNGSQVAMQPVNAEGTASKVLPAGTYDIQLQITKDADKLHYVSEGLQVTAANASLEVILSQLPDEEYEVLNVNYLARNVYKITVLDETSFQLEDLKGQLSGTYLYTANENGGYDVTDKDGNDVGMAIYANLNGTFSFLSPDLTYEQQMVQDGEATETFSGVYYVSSSEFNAAYIRSGCTYLELNTEERNFLIFTPLQSGVYEIIIHNATGTVGYYGSPYYVQTENTGKPTGDQSFSVEIKDSMIGTGNTGTTQLVIGVDSQDPNCIISITRVGDVVLTPQEMPWTEYTSDYVPSKYTLPEGLTIREFDLTASYDIVYNEADGFYHLGSADGDIVLVRLDAALPYGGCFGNILAGMNVGAYFYEDDGTFIKKELYNGCLLQYLGTLNKGMGTHSYSDGKLDDRYGVYPLTQDLLYIIQTYGEYTGWWNPEASNYLFATLPGVNVESAWLFMCCYASAN